MQRSRQLHITYTLCQLRKKSGRSQCIFASLNWCVICLPSWARLQLLLLLLLLLLLTIEPNAEPSFCSGKWAVNQLLNLLLYGLLSWLWLPTVEGGEWRRDRFHYNAACVTPLANSTGVGVAGSGHSTVLRLSVCKSLCLSDCLQRRWRKVYAHIWAFNCNLMAGHLLSSGVDSDKDNGNGNGTGDTAQALAVLCTVPCSSMCLSMWQRAGK